MCEKKSGGGLAASGGGENNSRCLFIFRRGITKDEKSTKVCVVRDSPRFF